MKLISWNVNGLRACMNKGFLDFFDDQQADIFCIQETKMQQGQAEVPTEGYFQYWNSAEKKGYSGTAVFCKKEPLSVSYDLHKPEHTGEGRAITLEFDSFYLVNVYVPNAQNELKRIDYRMQWEDDFREYVCLLDEKKPVIICGDMNVAAAPIDLKNPKANENNAGFTIQEREKFRDLLDSGYTDTFRYLYPDKVEYSWWSYRFKARERNAGWRIDYFLASERLKDSIADSVIHTEQLGSDHCPVELQINL
ncbi:MAG: exodeoxyribonuclease III [Christensenellales bacterium]